MKIKVLRIIARLNVGGPAIHAILLNQGLNDAGFSSHLIAGKPEEGEGDMAYLAKEKGVAITAIPELGRHIRPWNDLVALFKIFRIIREEKPDIVHTHTAKAGFLGRLAAIMAGVPVKVHSFHGHVFHSYFGPVKTRGFIFIEKLLGRFTDRIIVVSDAIKKDICNRFNIADESRVSVIGLGLDLGKFKDIGALRGKFRKELNIGAETALIGIVGRLVPVKNHRLFFDSIGLLEKGAASTNSHFLIIGDGELRRCLEEYAAALGIVNRVSFIGWRQDMPNVYADLDIVVLTSLNEGTPLSLIEAMAAKRPVVATAVGGVPDLIEDEKTGLLIESNSVVQLKDAILKLLSSGELRNKLGERASEYVRDRYSKERLVSDVENLYQGLIRAKKGVKRNK